MGLAISVGQLVDFMKHDEEGVEYIRRAFAEANEVLSEKGLPTHTEPESLPKMTDRAVLHGFSYSYLPHLYRAYARWLQEPDMPIEPCPPDEDPSADPAIDEEVYMFESHLLCHSCIDGFYFPIDFPEPISDPTDQNRIEGYFLGSSYRLQEELIAMAPALGIADAPDLSDATIARIREAVDTGIGLWREQCVWLTLFEACRLSKQYGTAICFK